MVAAQFRELRDQAVAAVDQVFAEHVRLSFFADNRQDPERSMVDINAVVRTAESTSQNIQSGPTDGWRTRVVPGESVLFIDLNTYAGPPIRAGDRVCALDRPGQPWWKIVDSGDRGQGRLIYQMAEL